MMLPRDADDMSWALQDLHARVLDGALPPCYFARGVRWLNMGCLLCCVALPLYSLLKLTVGSGRRDG